MAADGWNQGGELGADFRARLCSCIWAGRGADCPPEHVRGLPWEVALRSEGDFSRGKCKCWERKGVLGRKRSLRKGKDARAQLGTAEPTPWSRRFNRKKMLLVSFLHLCGPTVELPGTKDTCLEWWMDEVIGRDISTQNSWSPIF